jgi:hypothetical protein
MANTILVIGNSYHCILLVLLSTLVYDLLLSFVNFCHFGCLLSLYSTSSRESRARERELRGTVRLRTVLIGSSLFGDYSSYTRAYVGLRTALHYAMFLPNGGRLRPPGVDKPFLTENVPYIPPTEKGFRFFPTRLSCPPTQLVLRSYVRN